MMNKLLSTITILGTFLLCMGFTGNHNKAGSFECHIMVGIGYLQVKCGGDKGVSISQAADFFGVAGANTSSAEMRKTITTSIQQSNTINEKDISFSSTTKPYGVVVSYSKKIVGWNCSVTRMVVGFGDTLAAAEEDAERKKNNDANKATPYQVIKTYTCR